MAPRKAFQHNAVMPHLRPDEFPEPPPLDNESVYEEMHESSQEIYLAVCCACLGFSAVVCISLAVAFSTSVVKVDKDLDGKEREDTDRSRRLTIQPGQTGSPDEVGPLVTPSMPSMPSMPSLPTLVTLLPTTGFTTAVTTLSTVTDPPVRPSPVTTTARSTTTTTIPPIRGFPFVCTISVRRFKAMPKDGLCDVLFYDSLYKPQSSKLPVDMQTSAGKFIVLAQLAIRTRFGISFAIESQDVEREHTTGPFTAGLNRLWQRKISHLGFLNAYLDYTSVEHITRALRILKAIHEHLSPQQTPTRHVTTALGVAPVNPSLFRSYGYLMEQIYVPQIFIAIGHLSYKDNERPDCVIMPPTVFKFPRAFTPAYGHALDDSIDLLRHVAEATTYPALALSFTMQARIYQPLNVTRGGKGGTGPGGFSVFEPCKSGTHDFPPPTASCPSSENRRWDNYRYINNLRASLTFNTQENLTMTFDSGRALRAKACKTKQSALEVHYGLAAYSVDYDSPSKSCHELTLTGSYRRVSILATAHVFITESYKTAEDNMACETAN